MFPTTNRCHAAFSYFVNLSFERRISPFGAGYKFLKHSFYSSFGEEDDFSELGLPVTNAECSSSDLVTQKPKESLDVGASRTTTSGMPLHGEVHPRFKILPLEQGNHSPAFRPNVEKLTGVSRTKHDTEHTQQSRFITIDKIPSSISLFELKEAVSDFGEVLNASMIPGPNGFSSCHVEFKTVESKERAVATRGIFVRSFHLLIRNLHVAENITIRISNISLNIAEPAIHSICMSCGPVMGLSRTKEDTVDVFFSVSDSSTKEHILQKLNDISVDKRRWSAQILQGVTASTLKSESTQLGAAPQLSKLLQNAKSQLHTKRILLEDLEELHHAVMHLQNCPTR